MSASRGREHFEFVTSGRVRFLDDAECCLEDGFADPFGVLDRDHGTVDGDHSEATRCAHDDDLVTKLNHSSSREARILALFPAGSKTPLTADAVVPFVAAWVVW